jgi:hypothetical protein
VRIREISVIRVLFILMNTISSTKKTMPITHPLPYTAVTICRTFPILQARLAHLPHASFSWGALSSTINATPFFIPNFNASIFPTKD